MLTSEWHQNLILHQNLNAVISVKKKHVCVKLTLN